MAQAPTTVLQEINALYVALYDRAADNQGINYWAAQVGMTAAQAATTPVTTAQATLLGQQFVATQATYFTATYGSLNDIQYVQALYGNIGGNAGDAVGVQYWFSQLTALEAQAGQTVQSARAAIAGQFVDAMLGLDLTVGAAALGLSASDYAAAQARQAELQNKVSVSQFYANESALPGGSILTVTSNAPAPGNMPLQAAIDAVAGVSNDPATVAQTEAAIVAAVAAGNLNPILNLTSSSTQHTFTLTTGQDTIVSTGNTIINAPLVGNSLGTGVPTLSSFDSIVVTPATVPPGATPIPSGNSVLNASFSGTPSPQQPGSLNIQGIPIWNISNDLGTGHHQDATIILTGDAAGGPAIISGLMTLNFNDDETNGSLFIGDNSSPVYEPTGTTANGFTINVNSAVGGSFVGVDVDIAASAFTGKDTINVTANVVGGFSLSNASYIVPPEIYVYPSDGDNYNPTWTYYLHNDFSIGAGASAGPNGPIGFQTWDINSIGAKAVGTLNIIGLGGEGSSTANFINLSDDGSNTMLFANAISDGTWDDWKNVQTVNLSKTSGFVTITGLETNAQEVGLGSSSSYVTPTASTFSSSFQSYGGGGLLASDTTALTSIIGGAGNSFYDLTSLTAAAAHAGSWDGGHSTAGNSEIAFNDTVLTSGLSVTLTNISILDDVSSLGSVSVPTTLIAGVLGGNATLENGGEATGGVINMANFAGLLPLYQPYALLAENLSPDGGTGAPVPPGLPYTAINSPLVFTPPASQAALLPSTVTAAQALDYQNGIVPAGFQLLQFLDADGSTQTVLGADLTVFGDFTNFAVNMQDTADGYTLETLTNGGAPSNPLIFTVNAGNDGSGNTTFSQEFYKGTLNGFNITFWDESVAPNVNTGDTFTWFVSDDGATLQQYIIEMNPTVQLSQLSKNTYYPPTAFNAPRVIIDNYTTVNIVLPWESPTTVESDPQNFVILGSTQFIDQPVVTQTNASVNFFDNHADNGGSPPGGADNLVLGDTNFTDLLLPIATAANPAAIGVTSVFIDATSVNTVINDFGAGNFEIGATNATNLNAQSTAHLVMDLPGTLSYVGTPPFGPTPSGITVNGSLLGQNLLQGTSGLVIYDTAGHDDIAFGPASFGINGFGVYEALVQSGGQNGGWGNDTLTGGAGWGSVGTSIVGGAVVTTFHTGLSNAIVDTQSVGPGNIGDNFFPEGGTDVVNIAATEQGKFTSLSDVTSSSGTVLVAAGTSYENDSTVWVGFYDVCNSAGPWAAFNALLQPNYGIGGVLNQAITDYTISGGNSTESFVDGYGGSTTLVTINGFHLGPQAIGQGDTIVFGVADWATGAAAGSGLQILGLTMTDGITSVNSALENTNATLAGVVNGNGNSQTFFSAALYAGVGTQGAFATVTPPGTANGTAGVVVLDSINGAYNNAAALQNALGHDSIGSFNLAGPGMVPNTQADILVAYNLTAGGIAIADVTLTYNGSGSAIDTANLHPSVHNLVVINPTVTNVGLGNLDAHNIWFTA